MTKIKVRPLKWSDVEAVISTRFDGLKKPEKVWKCRSGETRVYAHVYKCSMANCIVWVKNPDLRDKQLRLRILDLLERALANRVREITRYTI